MEGFFLVFFWVAWRCPGVALGEREGVSFLGVFLGNPWSLVYWFKALLPQVI
jgi:hypothetical protein